ncbi:MAG: TetR/AcrR family transcriptional regulator, partial [Faecousia sp.]
MAVRSDGLQTEKRILRSCVRLFLENGYHQTTMAQILKEAQVSSSSFQNLFRSKDGVLLELVKFMFEN